MARPRTRRGSTLEFGSALCLLICVILVPLLNALSIPARYMTAQLVISDVASRLSHQEKASTAASQFYKSDRWRSLLKNLGISISKERISLVVTNADGTKSGAFPLGSPINSSFLPSAGSFIYTLDTTCDCTIPAFPYPITFHISSKSPWENLCRDPKSPTLSYFMEE